MEQDSSSMNATHIPISGGSQEDMPVVVAYGVGTDSTAMLIGMAARNWVPDLVLFANAGSEWPRTLAYIPVIEAWLAKVGFPPLTIVKNPSPKAGDASLYDECHRKSVLPSLAYGGHSCSLKWKVGPQDRFCREYFGWQRPKRGEPPLEPVDGLMPGRWRHGPWILKLIGYDAGARDARRQKRALGMWPPGYRYRYPLSEWGWDRDRCEAEIRNARLPLPGKSACFMCPASKKHEVEALAAEHPELAAKATELEARAHARDLRSVVGLGRRWSWTEHLRQAQRGSIPTTAASRADD